MLIEIWERLRGYDKWVQSLATIRSSTIAQVGFGDVGQQPTPEGSPLGWESTCNICWVDQQGKQHGANFVVDEASPLYQLTDGDTVSIRFNPRSPDEFYLPGLLESTLLRAWKWGLTAFLFVLVFILLLSFWILPDVIIKH